MNPSQLEPALGQGVISDADLERVVMSVAGVLVLRRTRPDWMRLAPVSFCWMPNIW